MSVVPQALPPSYTDSSSMLNTAHIVSAASAANIPESQGNSSSSNSPSPVPVATQQAAASRQASGSSSSSSNSTNETPSLENDKKAIYRHPLFPLMALLFEKCERATQTPDCPSADSFDVDIQAFVQHQEKDRKPFFSDDTELDALMVKAIQVLRIHLLELEKVNELCKDFCNRYITCLKSKMQSEHLLRTEVHSPPPNFDGSLSSSSSGSVTPNHTTAGLSASSSSQLPNASAASISSSASTVAAAAATLQSQLQLQQHQQQQQQQHHHHQQQQVVASMPPNNVLLPQSLAAAQSAAVPMGSLGQGQLGGTVYRMVQTPQGIVAQPIQIQATPISNQMTTMTTGPSLIHGSTPLSQVGAISTPTLAGKLATNSGSSTPGTVSAQIASIATNSLSQMGSDDEDISSKRKTKRGILPKTATKIMKSWLFQHIVHPYPTEDEKRQIAAQTNLTLLQVNNWFINARRRILQPMLDASNPDQAKMKKTKLQNRPLQRFWPDNIANLRPQMPSSHEGDVSENSSPLSPGGCSVGGGAGSNDSTSLAATNQPSNQQHLVMLSMAPTATTSTAIVTADGQVAVSLERLHSHQVPAHCSLSNSPGHTSIIIENSNDANSNNTTTTTTTIFTTPTVTNVVPSNNKVDNIQDADNNNNDDGDDDEEVEVLDPVSETVNHRRSNPCLPNDNSQEKKDSSSQLE